MRILLSIFSAELELGSPEDRHTKRERLEMTRTPSSRDDKKSFD